VEFKFEMAPMSRDINQGNKHDPAGNEPSGNEPVDDESAGEEPADNESASEESAGEEPAGEESVGNEPSDEKSVDNEPAGEEPLGEESADEESADEESVGEESLDEESLDEESVGEEPLDAEPVRIPINGELDLHTFLPRETARVIDAYIDACLERGIGTVRIIHGKGTGALRETVHAHLRRHPCVQSFRLGDETSGGWGATLACLISKTQ
jgi:DNA-nicking Smr family endonuclease